MCPYLRVPWGLGEEEVGRGNGCDVVRFCPISAQLTLPVLSTILRGS